MSTEKVAVLVPGQDSLIKISRDWKSAPGMRDVVVEMEKSLKSRGSIEGLLDQPADKREISALNAHRLLTAVALCIQENLRLEPDVASGHSAGLPLGYYFLGGYRDGIQGATKTMEKRAELLESAQKENPGVMYAFLWNGSNGFKNAEDRVKNQDGVWIACYNWENKSAAQIVITARRDIEIATLTQGKGNPLQLLTKLSIDVGAHSLLVKKAAKDFSTWLFQAASLGELQEPSTAGARLISDHLEEGESAIIFSNTLDSIIRSLSSIDQPVRFQRMVQTMYRQGGVRKIYEIGSGVLGNMIKRMDLLGLQVISIKDPTDLSSLKV